MGKMIPFWMIPSYWGLSTKQRKIEYAKYTLIGEELENALNSLQNDDDSYSYEIRKNEIEFMYKKISEYDFASNINLINLKHKKILKNEYDITQNSIDHQTGIITDEEYDRKTIDIISYDDEDKRKKDLLDIDLKYKKISIEEYDYKLNDIQNEKDSYEWKKNILDLDLQYNKINEQEHEKKLCTLNDEPYFEVINGKFENPDEDNIGSGGFLFELDYNEIFVNKLKENGWSGHSDDKIVDNYFKEICRQAADEEEIFDIPDISYGPDISESDVGSNIKKYS